MYDTIGFGFNVAHVQMELASNDNNARYEYSVASSGDHFTVNTNSGMVSTTAADFSLQTQEPDYTIAIRRQVVTSSSVSGISWSGLKHNCIVKVDAKPTTVPLLTEHDHVQPGTIILSLISSDELRGGLTYTITNVVAEGGKDLAPTFFKIEGSSLYTNHDLDTETEHYNYDVTATFSSSTVTFKVQVVGMNDHNPKFSSQPGPYELNFREDESPAPVTIVASLTAVDDDKEAMFRPYSFRPGASMVMSGDVNPGSIDTISFQNSNSNVEFELNRRTGRVTMDPKSLWHKAQVTSLHAEIVVQGICDHTFKFTGDSGVNGEVTVAQELPQSLAYIRAHFANIGGRYKEYRLVDSDNITVVKYEGMGGLNEFRGATKTFVATKYQSAFPWGVGALQHQLVLNDGTIEVALNQELSLNDQSVCNANPDVVTIPVTVDVGDFAFNFPANIPRFNQGSVDTYNLDINENIEPPLGGIDVAVFEVTTSTVADRITTIKMVDADLPMFKLHTASCSGKTVCTGRVTLESALDFENPLHKSFGGNLQAFLTCPYVSPSDTSSWALRQRRCRNDTSSLQKFTVKVGDLPEWNWSPPASHMNDEAKIFVDTVAGVPLFLVEDWGRASGAASSSNDSSFNLPASFALQNSGLGRFLLDSQDRITTSTAGFHDLQGQKFVLKSSVSRDDKSFEETYNVTILPSQTVGVSSPTFFSGLLFKHN
jgi:hypothetical protein